MSGVIYRYEVPVDDKWHEIDLSGPIVHVAGRRTSVVEFWAFNQGSLARRRAFRVYGTGQPLDDDCGMHVGTVVHPTLVWHLFSRNTPGVSE